MSVRLLLLASLAFAVGFAPAPLPRARRANPEEEDLRKMQGSWVVVKYEQEGRDMLAGIAGQVRWHFEGRRSTLAVGKDRTEYTITISVSAQRAITSTPVKEGQGGAFRGIYRFEGDSLILCDRAESDGPRPSEFTSKGGCELMVLKRR